MVSLSGSESVQVVLLFVYIFIYIAIIGDPIIKKDGWDPITFLSDLTPPRVCTCHNAGPVFRTPHILVFFVFNDVR